MKREGRKSADTEEEFEGVEHDFEKTLTIDTLLNTINIADILDEKDLISIGNIVVDGYNLDLDSRKPWEDDLEAATKLALQIGEKKTYPWQGAANVKYPLLATAAMQFAARAYPTLVHANGKLVKGRVVGSAQTD